MKRIALINPPSPFLISDSVIPPLGLMYLSSYLKQYTHDDITLFDLTTTSTEIPDGYDFYAFTATTPQYNIVLRLMTETKRRNPDAITIIGGSHATCFSNQCVKDGFEYVIMNEGEQAILNIVKNNVHSIHGNDIQITDINKISFPYRDFDGFEKYDYRINNKKCATMITTRGCPFRCSFCCKTWSNPVRLRSATNVLTEVELIKTKYNISDEIKHIDFSGVYWKKT